MTKPYAAMTYDEQRAFLGLPDVRRQVRAVAVDAAWRGFRRALTPMLVAFCEMGRQVAEATCPRHEWQHIVEGGGIVCQNCGMVMT